jgi:hypothetical protein
LLNGNVTLSGGHRVRCGEATSHLTMPNAVSDQRGVRKITAAGTLPVPVSVVNIGREPTRLHGRKTLANAG